MFFTLTICTIFLFAILASSVFCTEFQACTGMNRFMVGSDDGGISQLFLTVDLEVPIINGRRQLIFKYRDNYEHDKQLFGFRKNESTGDFDLVPCFPSRDKSIVEIEGGTYYLRYDFISMGGVKIISSIVDFGLSIFTSWYSDIVQVHRLDFHSSLEEDELIKNDLISMKLIEFQFGGGIEKFCFEVSMKKNSRAIYYVVNAINEDELDYVFQHFPFQLDIFREMKNIFESNEKAVDQFTIKVNKDVSFLFKKRYFFSSKWDSSNIRNILQDDTCSIKKQYDDIVFISDLHVHTILPSKGLRRYQNLVRKLKDCVFKRAGAAGKDVLLVVTGDISDFGTEEEFQLFIMLLHEVGIKTEDVLVVPGNHDVVEVIGTSSFSLPRFKLFCTLFYGIVVGEEDVKDRNLIFLFNDILKESKKRVNILSFDSNYKNYTLKFPYVLPITSEEFSKAHGQYYDDGELNEMLSSVSREDKVIVALHHHPFDYSGNEMIGFEVFQGVLNSHSEIVDMLVFGHLHDFKFMVKEPFSFILNLGSLHVEEISEKVCYIHPLDSLKSKIGEEL